VLVRIGYPNKTFDATGALKDEKGSAITGAGIATCDVAEITTGEGFTGRWNGNVRVVIIDAPEAAASLNGGKAAVSFDEGLTYEYGFESIDLSGTSFDIDVPSIGLTFTLGVAAEAPVALSDGITSKLQLLMQVLQTRTTRCTKLSVTLIECSRVMTRVMR
jgi:hypothetical protein